MEYRGAIYELFTHVLNGDDHLAKKCLEQVQRELQDLKRRVSKSDEEHFKCLASFVDNVASGKMGIARGKRVDTKSIFDSHLCHYLQPDSYTTKGNNSVQTRERQTRHDLSYRQHERGSGYSDKNLSLYGETRSYSNQHTSSSTNYQDTGKNNSDKHDYRTEDVETSGVVMRRQQPGSGDQNYVNFQRSKRASQRMVQNNPEIADLSDVNRPTKIAEGFSELYDNEWTEAFEVLRNTGRLTEKQIITLLLDIVEEAYLFCFNEADEQINVIEAQFARILTGETGRKEQPNPSGRNLLIQYRKTIAERSLERIQTNFRYKLNELCRQKLPTNPADDEPTAKFAQKAVELCWWMCVQEPPVHMCLTKKEPFNPALYKAYTKSGSEPDYFVWPALKLYRDGGVLSKGVAQFK